MKHHTLGRLTVDLEVSEDGPCIARADGLVIAQVFPSDTSNDAETRSINDAYLMAAAPEMLATLILAEQDLQTIVRLMESLRLPTIAEEFRGKARTLVKCIAKAQVLPDEECVHPDGAENGNCLDCGKYIGTGLSEYESNDER